MAINSFTKTTTGVVCTDPIQISLIVWEGNGAVGDTLLIQDNTGKTVWAAQAPGTSYNLSLSFGKPVSINGLNIITLTSGKVVLTYV